MRKKNDTLRENLLRCAQEVADREGPSAVNIRTIAGMAGVAAGTVYNYFANKEEILLALTQADWKQALREMQASLTAGSFCGQLEEIFDFLREKIDRSAGQLMGSLGKMEEAGQRMIEMQQGLETDLVRLLEQDKAVRTDIWDTSFTRQAFVRFIWMNMVLLLKEKTPDIHFLIAVIRRTIY